VLEREERRFVPTPQGSGLRAAQTMTRKAGWYVVTPKVFVSHSQKDHLWCRKFVEAGRALGWDIWFDEASLLGGNEWLPIIEREIQSRDVFILVVTPAALSSHWVDREWRLAFQQSKQIIPVLHKETRDAGGFLQGIQAVKAKGMSAAQAAQTVFDEVTRFLSASSNQNVVSMIPGDAATRPPESMISKQAPHGSMSVLSNPVHQDMSSISVRARSVRSLPMIPMAGPISLADNAHLAQKTVVIREHRMALEKAIELLEQLPDRDGLAGPEIRLTVQGTTLFKSAGSALRNRWSKARIQALRKGWHIQAFWRLDSDLRRTVRWVLDMFVLLQMGEYDPHYFAAASSPDGGLLQVPYEVLLIPANDAFDATAMVFFATYNAEFVDAALLTQDEVLYTLLERHLALLVSGRRTEPLFYRYPAGGRATFLRDIELNEEGGRLLVKPDLAALTMPLRFYQEGTPWTQRPNIGTSSSRRLAELQEARLSAIQRESRTAQYRDICSKPALESWMKTLTYSAYQSLGAELTVEPKYVIEHIHNAIHMLETYDNYQIALAESGQQPGPRLRFAVEDAVLTDPLWMIPTKGGIERVFMEILTRKDDKDDYDKDADDKDELQSGINLRFDEQRIAMAFEREFEVYWRQHVRNEASNKREVINWLAARADELTATWIQ
jgi:hypothetical protein